jgi:hypothetical protein
MTVRVTAFLDEAAPFKDTLHVLVSDGEDTAVPLEATGTGSTVVCEALAAGALDFGNQLCGRPWSMEVTVSNMGRRGVSLQWGNGRADELIKTFAKQARGSGGCTQRSGQGVCVFNLGRSAGKSCCRRSQTAHLKPLQQSTNNPAYQPCQPHLGPSHLPRSKV